MTLKIGSLFTGYGGLDMAVHAVFGDAETVWVSDIDKGASKILEHRYPTVPNLGDITGIDWTQVEPVDILTGGFPCQDVSHAGKRAGLKDGTRSGLWSHMAEAVQQLQPSLVVAENVRGLLSAASPSDVEPCPWCVGDESVSDLRALGTVLADLADIGYDARWCGLRAADVGSCHGRFRVFLVAYPTGDPWRFGNGDDVCDGRGSVGREPTTRGGSYETSMTLLPTPVVNDMGAGKTPSEWSEWSEAMRQRHGNGNGHGKSLAVEAQLLPTPMAAEGTKPSNTMGVARRQESGQVMLTNVVVTPAGLDETELLPTPLTSDAKGTSPDESYEQLRTVHKLFPTPTTQDPRGGASQLDRNTPPLNAVAEYQQDTFGAYAKAIIRWEPIVGRPAPAPTEPRPSGRGRLSPTFVEWMMGLPQGWVCDVPELSWAEKLKALGNGVVPQQAEAGLRHMLGEL